MDRASGRPLSFAKTLFRVRKRLGLAVRAEVSPLKQSFVGCRSLPRAVCKQPEAERFRSTGTFTGEDVATVA